MHVTLVGGGWGAAAWRPFVEAVTSRSGARPPRVAVLVVRDDDPKAHAERLVEVLRTVGPVEPVTTALRHGGVATGRALEDVDGVLVGGGITPRYASAIRPVADRIRALVEDGTPYGGFSAGAMIAGTPALLGGWRYRGVPVVPQETAEDLDGLALAPGLSLVPFAVDVHAGTWGTLGRLVAALDAGLVHEGVAVDEDTALVVDEGDEPRVVGTGAAWWLGQAADGVLVRRQSAG